MYIRQSACHAPNSAAFIACPPCLTDLGALAGLLTLAMPVMQHMGCPEDEARWFFQQFIIGLDYCHRMGIANRDIKVRLPVTLVLTHLCALPYPDLLRDIACLVDCIANPFLRSSAHILA